jgi:hypothetical protein
MAMTAEEMKEKMKAATAKVETKAIASGSKRPKPQAYKLKGDDDMTKSLVFGPLGSGKTFFALGPLLCGERLLVLSTDFGGNGLITLANRLKKLGKVELLDNILNLDVAEYEDVIAFYEDPLSYVPDLMAFKPTVHLWEGFSTFNNDLLDEYSDKNDEFRDVTEGFAHWYDIKRATLRALRKFFGFTLPDGTRIHKIMTSLEGKAQINKMTNESEKAPLVQTGARDFVGGGFDVVFNCYKEEDKNGHEEFFYRCAGASSKYAVKNRDFDLKPIEKAEPERIWKVLKGVA